MSDVILGSDTITINNRNIVDLTDGDIATITYPNNIAESVTGKNGNSIIIKNETGRRAEVTLRILLGSSDDKFLNGLRKSFELDPSSFTLITGEISQGVGDGVGGFVSAIHSLKSGYIQKRVEAKINVEADTEQGIAIYNLVFNNATRDIT